MFKDFAVYNNVNAIDPTVAYVRGGTEVTSGGVGNAWTRPHIAFIPDRDSKYLAIGAKVASLNLATVGSEHLNAQYFTQWQLERMPSDGLPRAFSPAREVQVVVKPDAINPVTNPSFETNTSGWITRSNASMSRVTTQAQQGAASLSFTAAAAAAMSVSTAQNASAMPITAGGTYSASVMTKAATTGRSVTVFYDWWTTAGSYISSPGGVAVTNTTTEWTKATITATAPPNAGRVSIFVNVTGPPAAGEVHYLDSVILGEGTTAPEYFDGSMGDDYIWEVGGTAHNTRSYYYENRLDRGEVIKRALQDAVPLGLGVGTAQFGVFTG